VFDNTGERGIGEGTYKALSYRHTPFHKIIDDSMVRGHWPLLHWFFAPSRHCTMSHSPCMLARCVSLSNSALGETVSAEMGTEQIRRTVAHLLTRLSWEKREGFVRAVCLSFQPRRGSFRFSLSLSPSLSHTHTHSLNIYRLIIEAALF